MQTTDYPPTQEEPASGEDVLGYFEQPELDEALSYAHQCMLAANHLNAAQELATQPQALQLLGVAMESYIERFKVPVAALEEDLVPTGSPASLKPLAEAADKSQVQRGRLAKLIAYLYAAAKRVFQFFFDYMRNQKLTARKIIPMTKDLIGRIDSHASSVVSAKIKDRGVVTALHIDGIAPRRAGAIFDDLTAKFTVINHTSGIAELAQVLSAAKVGSEQTFQKASEKLHQTLQSGMEKFMGQVSNPKGHPAFRAAHEGKSCYATDVMFGQHYITGVIGEPDSQGQFQFKAGITRDAEVPIRIQSLPVLQPDEIRQICRTALRLSEEIIKHSRDEDLVQKLMREASFFVTKEGGVLAVPALHNFVAVANNHYFAYLRYATRTMQQLMRWASLSVQSYESQSNA